jgi:hypothetical protein
MSKNSDSGEETKKLFSNPTVLAAIIGVIGTAIVALITASPQIIAALNPPTETAIPTSTVSIPPTSTPIPTETEALSTAASTEIPPTPTETTVPSPTPVDPGIACLDRWEVISSDPDLASPDSRDGCATAGIPRLGISTSGSELIFGQNNFREQGTFGISTSLPPAATIRMKVKRGVLTQGEFWVALSNEPSPESNMMIIAIQPEFGEVRTYVDQTNSAVGRYTWAQLVEDTNYGNGPTYTYDLILRTSGSIVDSRINFFELPSQIVNLPKYLFIGYQNKSTLGSVSISITVSNLTIEVEQ